MIYLSCRNGIFSVSLVSQFPLVQQLKQEAGIKGSINEGNYDSLLKMAGQYGLGIEVKERE